MNINWGAKLAFFAILFMAFVVFMVVKISQTDVPLVEENYYEKGIGYQEQIDAGKDAGELISIIVGKIDMAQIDPNKKFVFLQKHTVGDTINGKILFYRASDKKLDFKTAFTLIDSVPTALDITNLMKGKWKITVNWESNNAKRLIEKQIEL